MQVNVVNAKTTFSLLKQDFTCSSEWNLPGGTCRHLGLNFDFNYRKALCGIEFIL